MSGPRSQARTGEWPSQFARILAEALADRPPAGQAATWTAEQAKQRIRHLSGRELLAAAREREARRIDREAE
jgi:hypothetical protein